MAGTQVEIANLTRQGVAYIRNYWAETGNERELKIALESPGVLFWCSNRWSTEPTYHPFKEGEK
jgi:hypothetical protein